MSPMTRHAPPRTLSHLFFLDPPAFIMAQCIHSRPECLFDSFPLAATRQAMIETPEFLTL